MKLREKRAAAARERALFREAEETIRECARLGSLFDEVAAEELVEMCVLNLAAQARKHSYLRRVAREREEG